MSLNLQTLLLACNYRQLNRCLNFPKNAHLVHMQERSGNSVKWTSEGIVIHERKWKFLHTDTLKQAETQALIQLHLSQFVLQDIHKL